VIVTRHGERIDWVDPMWIYEAERKQDPTLSERGLKLASALGNHLKSRNIKHIFSSPFIRCIQTAMAVAEPLDLPINVEYGLYEWFGETVAISNKNGPLSPEKLNQLYPRVNLSYKSKVFPIIPETQESLHFRCVETAKKISEEYIFGAQASGDILLVTHAATAITTCRGFLLLGESDPIPASYFCKGGKGRYPIKPPGICSITEIKVYKKEKKLLVEKNSDISHLTSIWKDSFQEWGFPMDRN